MNPVQRYMDLSIHTPLDDLIRRIITTEREECAMRGCRAVCGHLSKPECRTTCEQYKAINKRL